MELIIGNKNYSSWSLRPWLLLQHFNVPFTVKVIPLFAKTTQDEMALFCPNKKVPVLIDNSETIWDSLSICEYINDQNLDNRAWPENKLIRAKARSVCAEMHAGFFALRAEMPMNCRRKPSKINYSEDCQQDINRIVDIWQQCLTQHNGPFLFGSFSIADAFYMPVVSRFQVYQIDVPELIKDYMTTMLTLPAYQQWLQKAQEEKEVISQAEL